MRGLSIKYPEDHSMTMPEFKQLVDEVKREVREISADTLRQMKASGEDFSLVDVREPEDWQKGTIPGAATIPRGVLEMNIDQVTTDKDRKVVLYCGGGGRSALAAYMLQRMGFRNVLSLAGGYRDWKDSEPR
jgi:rhodanese-related sulfurtransferase